jgi:hypothetical protein
MEVGMPLQMAFGITVRDVRAVLAKNAAKVVCTSDATNEVLAAKLFHSFSEEEMDDIALAAMDAFLENKPEAEGAHRAIRRILIKRGVLDVSRRVSDKQALTIAARESALFATVPH